jgi:hypothetical protein
MSGTQIGILVGAAIFFLAAISTILLITTEEGERAGPFGLFLGFLSYLANGAGYETGVLAYTIPPTSAVMLGWMMLNFPKTQAWALESVKGIGQSISDGVVWLDDRVRKRREYQKAVKRAKAKSATEGTTQTPREPSSKSIVGDIFD